MVRLQLNLLHSLPRLGQIQQAKGDIDLLLVPPPTPQSKVTQQGKTPPQLPDTKKRVEMAPELQKSLNLWLEDLQDPLGWRH